MCSFSNHLNNNKFEQNKPAPTISDERITEAKNPGEKKGWKSKEAKNTQHSRTKHSRGQSGLKKGKRKRGDTTGKNNDLHL